MDEDFYVASGHDLREEDWTGINLLGAYPNAKWFGANLTGAKVSRTFLHHAGLGYAINPDGTNNL